MPAARMAMYHQGIELYCAPTADGHDGHHATMRHIAQEGRCFVLTANQVMRVADFPAEHERPYGGSSPHTQLVRLVPVPSPNDLKPRWRASSDRCLYSRETPINEEIP